MKKTAVEWLLERVDVIWNPDREKLIEQAKEMEKEQIIDAYETAEKDCGKDFLHGDLYYHETFKPYCMPEGLDTPEKHEQYLKDIGLINNK